MFFLPYWVFLFFSAIYFFIKGSLSSDILLCGGLGSKHQLTNSSKPFSHTELPLMTAWWQILRRRRYRKGQCYSTFPSKPFLTQSFLWCQPCSWELRTMKLKFHLMRTRSLNLLPLKPGVGQYIAMHATLTARDFFLANFYPSGPFTCIFSKTTSEFFPYVLADTVPV